jgi:hypothetical protein
MRYQLLVFLLIPIIAISQNDLLDEIDSDTLVDQNTTAAFKGLKIVNFESTKLVAKGNLNFIVSHRFGSVKGGFDSFFGLDEAVTRLQFVFGLTEAINIGVSRSSLLRIYDVTAKFRLIQQKENGFPFSIVSFNAILINTALDKQNLPLLKFKHRLGYTAQLLISRKVNTNLTLQLAPTFFHDNYVAFNLQTNSQLALGLGGRYKLGKRWSINADYGLHLNRADNSPFKNPLSIGFDLETGGHVFQMHFSNAQAMNTNGFLGQGTGDWGDGDVYFGFNLSRTF